jgi:multiple sugar transport system permease protein
MTSPAIEAARAAPGVVVAAEPQPKGLLRRAWWLYALLLLGLALVLGPFVWMLLSSFKSQTELVRVPPTWLPETWTIDNYDRLFTKLDFPRYFFNSVVIAGAVVLANIVFCSMVGYALAKLRFAGKNLIMLLVLATLMVPGTVTMVPLFVLMSKLNLVNSYWAVILPFAVGPFGVFLMRQFMMAIPNDLLEAARVDGAREFHIFWKVVVPLSWPGMAALGIITFLASWNSFLWPLIVLTDDRMYTLPVALGTFAIGQHQADYGLLMAGAVALVLPIIIVFLVLQRQFTESVASTGLKG